MPQAATTLKIELSFISATFQQMANDNALVALLNYYPTSLSLISIIRRTLFGSRAPRATKLNTH
jgi:ABC-type Na+ efflux pump permease subunit